MGKTKRVCNPPERLHRPFCFSFHSPSMLLSVLLARRLFLLIVIFHLVMAFGASAIGVKSIPTALTSAIIIQGLAVVARQGDCEETGEGAKPNEDPHFSSVCFRVGNQDQQRSMMIPFLPFRCHLSQSRETFSARATFVTNSSIASSSGLAPQVTLMLLLFSKAATAS